MLFGCVKVSGGDHVVKDTEFLRVVRHHYRWFRAMLMNELRPMSAASASVPWVLVCAGANLVLAQYWMMKEYLLVLESSELTILLVMAAFFASCSLGYLMSSRSLGRPVAYASLVLSVIQLLFPWLLKELAAAMYQEDIPHMAPFLLGFGVLVMAPLYTILLPSLIRMREALAVDDRGEAVALCYGLELGGALLGIAIILTVGRVSHVALLTLYFVNLSLILAFVHGAKSVLAAAVPISLCYGFLYGPLERAATVDFYQARDGVHVVRLLGSAQSLYNRIDVLQDADGHKSLLMNGLEYFNPTNLEAFNRYIAGIPSQLMPGSRVLIVGTGSLSSVFHASKFSNRVESVEIDPQVVGLTATLFREFNRLDQVQNWTLHIDDAKHFLGSSHERYDLIILDLIPPVYVQTALLFTREFYELAKSRLTPHGVLSVYTSYWFEAESIGANPSPVEKTIDSVFPEYLVLNGREAGMAFVYASTHLPFSKQDVLALLEVGGTKERDEVWMAAEVRPLLQGKREISLNNFGVVLQWAPSAYTAFASKFRVWR